jgi:UDPglucose--hexose-1-phosphate uridylyltransferase
MDGIRELRRDPVTGAWVILAGDLARHPGQFHQDPPAVACHYCAGQERRTASELLAFRDSGTANEPGWRVRVVPSSMPVLRVEGRLQSEPVGPYDRLTGIGAHEVVVETPDHGIALGELSAARITEILAAMRERFNDLRRDQRIRAISAFRNPLDAASHGHWQMVGLPVIPKRVRAELAQGLTYFEARGRCVTCDLLYTELKGATRLVSHNPLCTVIAPYASRVPFESWIIPSAHGSHFEHTPESVLQACAEALRSTVRKLAVVLQNPLCQIAIQSAPLQDGSPLDHYHWRIEIAPVVAYGAGPAFEWATDAHVNPTAPEEAARFLREAAD